MNKIDIYQEVTDKIIKSIEEGVPAWRKPWSGGACSLIPTRANHDFYNGINVLVLWLTAAKKGFSSDYWMTYKQARALGGNVRKGEKSTRVIFYGTIERESEEKGKGQREEKGDKDRDDQKIIPYIKTYAAFNGSQIDGLPSEFHPETAWSYGTVLTPEIIRQFEAFPIEIKTSGVYRAAYDPDSDFVEMPPVANFINENDYYATLAHELCHATAHQSRLNRVSEKLVYSFEELIAEIGACMVCARLGITPDFEQSAAYVDYWHKILKEDKKAIFKAASKAQKACDYVLDQISALNKRNTG